MSGVYPNYQSIQDWPTTEGGWFSERDELAGSAVAVVGQTIVDNLFPANSPDPIGQTIRINGGLFRIVGVFQMEGAQGASNSDDTIFVARPDCCNASRVDGFVPHIPRHFSFVAQASAWTTSACCGKTLESRMCWTSSEQSGKGDISLLGVYLDAFLSLPIVLIFLITGDIRRSIVMPLRGSRNAPPPS